MSEDFDEAFKQRMFLQQSKIIVSNKQALIQTILGSCVAVCLWDKINKIGGMNHYIMPLWNGEGLATPKYGNIAIELLIEKIIEAGGKQKYLQAKVFGGGNVMIKSNESITVGKKNVELAYTMLKQYKIKVIKEDVLGQKGRNLLFNPTDGSAYLKYINSLKSTKQKVKEKEK